MKQSVNSEQLVSFQAADFPSSSAETEIALGEIWFAMVEMTAETPRMRSTPSAMPCTAGRTSSSVQTNCVSPWTTCAIQLMTAFTLRSTINWVRRLIYKKYMKHQHVSPKFSKLKHAENILYVGKTEPDKSTPVKKKFETFKNFR